MKISNQFLVSIVFEMSLIRSKIKFGAQFLLFAKNYSVKSTAFVCPSSANRFVENDEIVSDGVKSYSEVPGPRPLPKPLGNAWRFVAVYLKSNRFCKVQKLDNWKGHVLFHNICISCGTLKFVKKKWWKSLVNHPKPNTKSSNLDRKFWIHLQKGPIFNSRAPGSKYIKNLKISMWSNLFSKTALP